MALWLVCAVEDGWTWKERRMHLDAGPCPTVTAAGLWGRLREHVWIEDDGLAEDG